MDRPFSLSLDELLAIPSREDDRTLMCISYDILAGDGYIGNQRWRGFPVADLLDRAGVRPEARFVLWRSADDYTESLALDVARDPGTWIVFEMDGKPLDADHGFPARILIPDRFGMKGPKWLKSIVLCDTEARLLGAARLGPAGEEKIMSRIDLPRAGDGCRSACLPGDGDRLRRRPWGLARGGEPRRRGDLGRGAPGGRHQHRSGP